ncbi:hypothetical protein J5N97_024217 [Dioscorea zingiberensis]|uniref:Peptidase A1 domain-containing protein n=1 Tax=Dioscorea zingiberensis TaxID=325984 RepID=A0A9D5C6Q7_9LILI|nr:hypothetical protein J5N97_024217 [Dioscorea zingiberensis]
MTLLYLCIFIFMSFASLSIQMRMPPGTKDGGGFSAELIHSYSPLSPFYNPNITAADRWASINLQSSLRLKYFEAISNSTNSALQPTDDGQTPVILVDFHYLIKLSIGNPPKDALLSLDTGSTLLWIQCLPCTDCYTQGPPIFDPSKSNSYKSLPCYKSLCLKIPGSNCAKDGYACEYAMLYEDGSYSIGDGALEDFTFTMDSNSGDAGRTIELKETVFGCGHDNKGTYVNSAQGVAGMSMGLVSLVTQMSGWIKGRFSYCFKGDKQPFQVSHMLFGDRAILKGAFTPLAVSSAKTDYYFLNLIDISVGGQRLSIPPGTFTRDAFGKGGVMLDTGTPLTYLKRAAYDLLEKKVRDLAPRNWIYIETALCYRGKWDDVKLPSCTFHFQSLDVSLSADNIFYPFADENLSIQMRIPPATEDGGGFSAELIHSHSPLSPFYNPNITAADQWASIHLQSNLRLKYFEAMTNLTNTALQPTATMRDPMIRADYFYLIKLSMGTPSKDVLLSFDTGSNMLWLQCLPCTECYAQGPPIFDPSKSSSFKRLACFSSACEKIPGNECSMDGKRCTYDIRYADGSLSIGEVAYEDFIFPTSDSGDVGFFRLKGMVFGCGHRNEGTFIRSMEGVAGMGMGPMSLLSQMSGWTKARFSHCFVDVKHQLHVSQMLFGDRAMLIGNFTPFAVSPGKSDWFYLNLIDISVGGERLSIPPGTFTRDASGEGGMVLDTGTPLTCLKRAGYDLLEKKVRDVVTLKRVDMESLLCYEGDMDDLDAMKLPSCTFHFQGLDLWLSPYNLFYVFAKQFLCLAIEPSETLSVFGSFSQQNINVGYDLYNEKIYMYPTDCSP